MECVYLRMSLLVLAFPIINTKDLDWIQSWRKKNDELFGIVEPHFTIVFAVDDEPEEEFIKEIEFQTKGVGKIEFKIKRAIVHKDEFRELYQEFLVPAKGYEEIVELHDKLYRGRLLPHWRRDIEYIPHITIGNLKDKSKCEQAVDELNSKEFFIPGRIEDLTIVRYSNNVVQKIKVMHLQ
jgi:2'-5' RNA ligase